MSQGVAVLVTANSSAFGWGEGLLSAASCPMPPCMSAEDDAASGSPQNDCIHSTVAPGVTTLQHSVAVTSQRDGDSCHPQAYLCRLLWHPHKRANVVVLLC